MDVQAIAQNYRDIIANHYFDLRGRVGRGQFWWFAAANFIAMLLAQMLGNALHLPLREVYALAVLLPSAGLGARRLQDTGRNGQLVWALLLVVAVVQVVGIFLALTWIFTAFFAALFAPGLVIGGILIVVLMVVLIWMWCQPGNPGPNAYGPVPPVFDPARPAAR